MGVINKLQREIAIRQINDKIENNLEEAIVSFSFDDCPNPAFTIGASLLNKYGMKGTYYISLGLKDDKDNSKPYFDFAHLSKIVEEGGELGSHTYNHLHFYKDDVRKIRKDLYANDVKINELIPGYVFESFSYPYGEQSAKTKKIIREKFTSARGVKPGVNKDTIDLNNLLAVELTPELNIRKARAYVNEAIKNKGWLIFYTHDIGDNPSPYGCTDYYFEAVLRYVYSKKVKTMLVKDVVKLLTK